MVRLLRQSRVREQRCACSHSRVLADARSPDASSLNPRHPPRSLRHPGHPRHARGAQLLLRPCRPAVRRRLRPVRRRAQPHHLQIGRHWLRCLCVRRRRVSHAAAPVCVLTRLSDNGTKCCNSDLDCVVQTPYFSQCLPKNHSTEHCACEFRSSKRTLLKHAFLLSQTRPRTTRLTASRTSRCRPSPPPRARRPPRSATALPASITARPPAATRPRPACSSITIVCFDHPLNLPHSDSRCDAQMACA